MSKLSGHERSLLRKIAEECVELAFECLKRIDEDGGREDEIDSEIDDVRKQMRRWRRRKS